MLDFIRRILSLPLWKTMVAAYKSMVRARLEYPIPEYSRTSIARTAMARLPWLIRTRFSAPTKFFR